MICLGSLLMLICKLAWAVVGVSVAVGVGGAGVWVAVGIGVAVGGGVLVGVAVIKPTTALAVLLLELLSVVVVTLAEFWIVAPVAFGATRVWPVIVITPPKFRAATVPVKALLVKLRAGPTPFAT